MDILEFSGEYRWLSNFWPAQVVLDGESYPSVENAYQAAKTYPSQRGQFLSCTAGQAKRLGRRIGRSVEMRADWEQIKISVMRSLVEQKFAPGSSLGERLKATGDGNIIEGNNWGDVFWGVCNRYGYGQNMLGRLIMERRAFLQNYEK